MSWVYLLNWENPVPECPALHFGASADARRSVEDMNGYLFTEDISVHAARTRDDLAALLRIVHVRADRPSVRALEAKTRYYKTPLSKTVVSEVLKGTRFPRKAVMLSFLSACGVPDEAMEPWRRAWEQVAAGALGMRSGVIVYEGDDLSGSAGRARRVQQKSEQRSRGQSQDLIRDSQVP